MRSQARASSAGSTLGRGRLATFFIAAALLALALFASSAFASKQWISDFGTFAESGSYGGEFNNPRDIAVNETGTGPANAGDTYVADEANNRIERFDSAGNFISAWGKDTIAAVVNERQRVVTTIGDGTFTLSFDGSTTAPISPFSAGFVVQEDLAALPSIGGETNVAVSGDGKANNPYVVTFKGTLGGSDQPLLIAATGQLIGTVEVSTIVNGSSSVPDNTGTGFEICTVAIECQAGTASGENGALNAPQSVAVDQDTGNIYVSDRENRRIDEYDGEGNFIRAFGFDVAESGPGDTGTGYEVCSEEEEGDTCKSGEAGSGAGQYGEGFAERGFGITVSPADANASTGTVYLADSGNRRVDTFDLDGTDPTSFGSSTNFGEEQPRSVAVDSRGIVYASDSTDNGVIQRYDSQNADGDGVDFLAPIVAPGNEEQEITFTGFSTGDNFKLTCPDGTPTEELTYAEGEVGFKIVKTALEENCGAADVSVFGEPPAITVDFQGALGSADQPQMTCTVLGGAGSCSVTTTREGRSGPLQPGSTAGLAVNPAGTALYVLRESSPIVVQQFGPAHEPGLSAPPTAADDTNGTAASFGSNSFFVPRGFGFDSASGRLFIAALGDPDGPFAAIGRAHRVYVLDDSSSLPSPTASTPSVTDTATRSATFHGDVDPEGGLVSCKFQYSTDEASWKDVNDLPSCPLLNQNGDAQEVEANASGLAPNTHYFVRLQVTRPYFSGFTPVDSASQSFTTASGPPIVSKASARAIDEHSVRVTASIDPSHSPTTYVVEYGTSASLGSSTEPVSVGSGTEPVEVSPVIGGLSPATQYYFKLVATSLVDSAASDTLPVATFPAPPSFGSCPNERFRTGPSAKLPDCRAYEQVTPNDKFGSDAYGDQFSVEASAAGDGITSYTLSGFPGSEGFSLSNVFLSHFGGGEWSTAGLNPPPSYGDSAEVLAWTPDLRLSFASARDNGAGLPAAKLVMRDSTDGSRTVLIPQGVGFTGNSFVLGGAFDDDSKVVFEATGRVPVTSGPAPVATELEQGNVYLYDRDSGELTLAGLLPDSACASPPCVPAEGSKLPATLRVPVQDGRVVSPNGNIYFTDRATGRLYLRRDAAGSGATTEYVAASHKTNGGGPGGVATNSPQPASFIGATPDGSKAFFTSTEELTNDANTGPEPLLTPAVGRANSNGSGFQPNFIPVSAKWTAVDSGHIYWTDAEAGTIGRADIGGANPEPNFITGLESPEGIAVDSGHIYWAEARDHEEGHGTIGRAALAGTSVEKEFITGASDPRGVAVNSAYLYWTANAGIGRATIAGGSPEQSFLEAEHGRGIAVDSTNLYWIDQRGPFGTYIYEYKVSGEFVEVVGVSEGARGLAIDSSHLYWSDTSADTIVRSKLDLSNIDPKFIVGAHGIFGVAADAGHVYWASDPSGLPPSPGNDLYRYDAAGGGLIDLAPDSTDPHGAEVVGVLGYSDDGSHVYLAANGDLDGSGPAQLGDCVQTFDSAHTFHSSGSCSIYLWQDDGAGTCATVGGCVSFVVPADGEGFETDGYNWADPLKTSRVSANGRILVFRSQLELTSYDNQDTSEFYRYDAASGQVSCISCNPTGAPPVAAPDLKNPDLYHAPATHLAWTAQDFLSRNLSADGNHFFFQSADKLVPADVNGDAQCLDIHDEKEIARLGIGPSCRDVYEWEAPGTPGGSCTTTSDAYSPANGGCIYLLSTGTGIHPSYLADVSESGDAAFIFSRQKLVPSDEDSQEDIYAVRVDGGLASQNTPRPANCEGDACRGASSHPSNTPGAGSGVFEGPGNPKQGTNKTRCPKGKRTVHSKGKVRCVAKKHKKKAHKHKSKVHKRAANNDRRASR